MKKEEQVVKSLKFLMQNDKISAFEKVNRAKTILQVYHKEVLCITETLKN